jgi:hypothetical protein
LLAMTVILRKNIYLCDGDKRILYTLPADTDKDFASKIAQFGKLKTMDLGDGFLWVVEIEELMQLRFESDKNVLDARFRKSIYDEKIRPLEDFLKEYFQSEIEKVD